MLLQRKPTQLFDRQIHKNADALIEHAHAIVEGKRLLGVVALRLGRGLARPNAPASAGQARWGKLRWRQRRILLARSRA